jgi:Protein of unknown function (DUF1573)
MEKIVTLICTLVASTLAFTQTTINSANGTSTLKTQQVSNASLTNSDFNKHPDAETLTFEESEYDFGKIPQGKPVTHVFIFKNTGDAPFALDRVQASCGCTTPEWNKDTIPPGGTSKIIVGYNAMNEGPFAKPVTITYNGNQVKQIVIKGDVWKTPQSSAPLNDNVNSLQNE